MRRLHRGGEGQYLVNGAHVRRTDVVELLSDVGLGSAMGSIVSQGRVEAILASKPEERRTLVEEAAGLGKFKRRRHRAELKFARVATQVERARDVEAEVTKRLRPLALQATAAERAEKLGVEIAGLRAGIATLDMLALDERRSRRQRAAGPDTRPSGGRPRKRWKACWRSAVGRRRRWPRRPADARVRRRRFTGCGAPASGSTSAGRPRSRCSPALREAPPAVDAGARRAGAHRRGPGDGAGARDRRARGAASGRPGARRGGCVPGAVPGRGRGGPRAGGGGGRRCRARRLDARGGAAPARGGAGARPRQPDRARPARAVRAARRDRRRPERATTRRDASRRHRRGPLLRPGARRAHVHGRHGRGGAARAGGSAPAAAGGGGGAEGGGRAGRAAAGRPARWSPPARRCSSRSRQCSARPSGSRRRCSRRPTAAPSALGELAAELRALGGREVELRRAHSEAAERVAGRRRRGRAVRGRARRGAAPSRRRRAPSRQRAHGRSSPRSSSGSSGAASSSAASTRSRRRSTRRRRSALPSCARSARTSSARSTSCAKLRDELTETVDRRFAETFDAVQRNFAEVASTLFPGAARAAPADRSPRKRDVEARDRGGALARRQARHAPLAALRRREGARGDLVPVRAVPRSAVPVLPARRGRGRSRRHEHRPLLRAPAAVRRPGAVHRRHAPEADDGGGGRALRRDDGRGRRLPDRLAAPAPRGRRRGLPQA